MHRFRFVVPVLLSLGIVSGSAASFGQVGIGINITIAPPLLPVYEQPPIPAPDYIWTPGYWSYGPYGYYWVPSTWVQPPAVGLLWTPGYWGWNNGVYVFNSGYWGPQVGFYGGINYGFGYGGLGYQGGYWNNGALYYNRAVNNIGNTQITNVYNRTVVNNTTINNVSYNGGNGGTVAQPTPQQRAFAREPHTPPTPVQVQHQQAASSKHALLASVNQGRPPIAATSRPAQFSGPGVVPARNAGGAERASGAPEPSIPGQHGPGAERAGGASGSGIPGQHGPEGPKPDVASQHGGAPAIAGSSPALRPPAEAGPPAGPGEVPARPETRAPAAQARVAPQAQPAPVHPAAVDQAYPAAVHAPVARQVQLAPVHPEAAHQVTPAPHPRQAAPAQHRAAPQHEEKKPPPG